MIKQRSKHLTNYLKGRRRKIKYINSIKYLFLLINLFILVFITINKLLKIPGNKKINKVYKEKKEKNNKTVTLITIISITVLATYFILNILI